MNFAWCHACRLHILRDGKAVCGETEMLKAATTEDLQGTTRNCRHCWRLILEGEDVQRPVLVTQFPR